MLLTSFKEPEISSDLSPSCQLWASTVPALQLQARQKASARAAGSHVHHIASCRASHLCVIFSVCSTLLHASFCSLQISLEGLCWVNYMLPE